MERDELKEDLEDTLKGSFREYSEFDETDVQPFHYRPENIAAFEKSTKFTRRELQTLYRGFKQECPNGVVSEETFKTIYAQFFPQGDSSKYAHFVFNSFDKGDCGMLTFEQFISGLSMLCRGDHEEKLKWAFELYDINNDGQVTREEMTNIVESIYEMLGHAVTPSRTGAEVEEHVDYIFQKMDLNGDGVITYDEYMTACMADPNLLNSLACLDSSI